MSILQLASSPAGKLACAGPAFEPPVPASKHLPAAAPPPSACTKVQKSSLPLCCDDTDDSLTLAQEEVALSRASLLSPLSSVLGISVKSLDATITTLCLQASSTVLQRVWCICAKNWMMACTICLQK